MKTKYEEVKQRKEMEASKKGQDKQHNIGTKNNQTQRKDTEKMQTGNQTQASEPNTMSNTHMEE